MRISRPPRARRTASPSLCPPAPRARRASSLALLLVATACPPLVGCAPSLGGLVPGVRLIGWSAVERIDRRYLPAAADRRLTPLDRGFAVHLDWALDRPGATPPLDGSAALGVVSAGGFDPLDGPDPEIDEDAAPERWRDPDDEATDAWGDPLEADAQGWIAPAEGSRAPDDTMPRAVAGGSSSPGGPPPDLWVRRLTALHTARHRLEAAPTPAARRRAAVDVDEARARLRLLGEGSR